MVYIISYAVRMKAGSKKCRPAEFLSSGQAKAGIVVAVGGIVRVAISRPDIPAVVDPTAAA
jgi:hypothetical protein